MTPLRQRLLDDLRLRNYAPRTIQCYVAHVARFAQHFGRSPDQLGADHVRAFQLELLRRRVSWSQFNQTVCALRFFYRVTLGRPEQLPDVPYGKRPRTLPSVLAPQEVSRLLDAARPGRDRLLLQVAYACGLRISERVHLRVTDVDSARMVVVVRQGKGRKDRLVPLSPRLLDELRVYWRRYRPAGWLFPGADPARPLCASNVQRLCRRLVRRIGLTKPCTPHTLRHSYATHLHVVFTLPAELSDLALANPTTLYDLLFTAAAATLRVAAANPKRLGAMLGVLLVLHTWGQTLQHHPHVHGVVTGGGLSCNADGVLDDAPRWVACRPGFLLPVRVLSRLFRGKFLDGLRTAFAQGKLVFPGRLTALRTPSAFAALTGSLAGKEWVVYSKPPFGGPAQVLKYLARYTHRVALSNSRLVALEHGRVTFRYQDYADGRKHKTMTLPAEEFLRRFVQHVLPRGFVKVRHYGLSANRCREQRLHLCRRLLLPATVATKAAGGEVTGVEPAPRPCCPWCGGERIVRRALEPAVPSPPPLAAPPGAPPGDTS